MKLKLLDTSVLLDPHFIGADFYNFRSSTITRAEIIFGTRKAELEGNQIRARTNSVLVSILDDPDLDFWIPFNHDAADSYGLLAAHASHTAPAKARSKDALIAAIAHANRMSLVTQNVKNFAIFDDFIKTCTVSDLDR